MRTLTLSLCCVTALLLQGCINIGTELAPLNTAVKPMTEGSDCSYVVFGFGFGTNTMAMAMANAEPPIVKVRQSMLRDWSFLNLVAARCLEVTGESAPRAEKPVRYDPTNAGSQ